MNWFAQVAALIGFGLRSLPARLGAALAAIFGIAGVVAVLVGVLSIGAGFHKVMADTGAPDTAIVLRSGADSEMTSVLLGPDADVIATAPGVARAAGKALASPELFVVVDLPKRSTGTPANVPFRGVKAEAFTVRPEVKIVEGRPFAWGRNEVIVGRAAAREFAGLEVGNRLQWGENEWQVVGVFAAEDSVYESEIWTDVRVLQPAYRRGSGFQSVYARLESPDAFQRFKDALTADPRLDVDVMREDDYYAEHSRVLRSLVNTLGNLIALLMAVGATFGALNTMYSAVAARSREIATLRALGFQGGPVVASVMAESLLLALVGGLVGGGLAWLVADGYQTATMNWQSFSQVAFSLSVTPRLLAGGIAYALAMGFLGGIFPAIGAVRTPITIGLRQV